MIFKLFSHLLRVVSQTKPSNVCTIFCNLGQCLFELGIDLTRKWGAPELGVNGQRYSNLISESFDAINGLVRESAHNTLLVSF